MLLVREVHGWLRYLINKDPLCKENGIVVEEMYSPFCSLHDMNDGVRTLVIHNVQSGMLPRIEFRAIGIHPQIYWFSKDTKDSLGELITTTNQFGFPGDFKSWDCSDTCRFLLELAKEKLCCCQPEAAETTARKMLEYPIVKRILDAAERSVKKNSVLTSQMVNKWLKENEGADLMDFALSVLHYFDKSKVTWEEIQYLENDEKPGRDIIEWSWLKRQLNTRERLTKLPPPIVERVSGEKITANLSLEVVQARFDDIIRHYAKGSVADSLSTVDVVKFGVSATHHLSSGAMPFQYLQQLELCDRYESILPWSLIRRSILSYAKTSVDAGTEKKELSQLIIDWLSENNLLLLLYNGDEAENDALIKAIKAQLDHHINNTLKNSYWMNVLLASFPIANTSMLKRALQVEFDLWLLTALSPSTVDCTLPLSPYAFSIKQKEQSMYNSMYKVWEDTLSDYLSVAKKESSTKLVDAIAKFYAQLISVWKSDVLKDYKTKVPSTPKILSAIEAGNLEDLFDILCGDLENEVGTKVPDTIKVKLMSSPYFNAITREIKIQGMSF